MEDKGERPAKATRARKGSRRPPATVDSQPPGAVVIVLTETDALLALSAGAVIRGIGGSEPDGLSIQCWRGPAPATAIQRASTADPAGGTILLKVQAMPADLSIVNGRLLLSLPTSLSRIIAAIVASDEYLRLLVARVGDFPDIVIDAVPLTHDPASFSPEASGGDTSPEPAAQAYERVDVASVRVGEKTAGAVAGLLVGLSAGPRLSVAELDAAWSTVPAAVESGDAGFICRLGDALSIEPSDVATRSFVEHLVRRLRTLRTATGFDPNELLAAVMGDVRSGGGVERMDVLERFASIAQSVLKLEPGAPRDLLVDGGSVMLRGALAFLQTPDIERLEAATRKGSRMGPRVGAFALALAGYYTGTTALSRRYKAEPAGRLASLGDIIEAIEKGVSLDASSACEVDDLGVATWNAELAGRRVAARAMLVDSALQPVLQVASREKWGMSFEEQALALTVPFEGVSRVINVAVIGRGPFESMTPCVSVFVARPLKGPGLPAVTEASLRVAGVHAVMASLSGAGASQVLRLEVFLSKADLVPEHIQSAVSRLSTAAQDLDSQLPARPQRKSRKDPALPQRELGLDGPQVAPPA